MTKSRTLRRAGAVVLSLAMAATTVFAGNVSQAASKKKVTLSSTKKTFAAKGGTATVKIKGATSAKISSTTVKSSKTSVATVKKSSKVKFKVTAKKNTATKKKTATITAKVKIAKKYQKKYTKKSYSLKYKVTVKAATVTKVTGVTLDNTTPKIGDAITATVEPADATNVKSYQWYRTSGTEELLIKGETTATYTVGVGDVGCSLYVVVTDTAGEKFYSKETSRIAEAEINGLSISGVSGKITANDKSASIPVSGDVLSAAVSPANASELVTYQWYRGTSAITGATGSSYTVADEDQGNKLSVKISAIDKQAVYIAAGKDSAETEQAACKKVESLTTSLSKTDNVNVGDTITATIKDGTKDLNLGADFKIQWYLDSVAAGNEGKAVVSNAKTYTVAGGDNGKALIAHIEGIYTGFYYGSIDLSTAAAQNEITTPTITTDSKNGTASFIDLGVGNSMTATIGAGETATYQWYKDGVAISGATDKTYTFTAADGDAPTTHKYRCEVTGTGNYKGTKIAYANADAAFAVAATTTIDGFVVKNGSTVLDDDEIVHIGDTLTVSASPASANNAVTFKWYYINANGDVESATGASFKVPENVALGVNNADTDHTIAVCAYYEGNAGDTFTPGTNTAGKATTPQGMSSSMAAPITESWTFGAAADTAGTYNYLPAGNSPVSDFDTATIALNAYRSFTSNTVTFSNDPTDNKLSGGYKTYDAPQVGIYAHATLSPAIDGVEYEWYIDKTADAAGTKVVSGAGYNTAHLLITDTMVGHTLTSVIKDGSVTSDRSKYYKASITSTASAAVVASDRTLDSIKIVENGTTITNATQYKAATTVAKLEAGTTYKVVALDSTGNVVTDGVTYRWDGTGSSSYLAETQAWSAVTGKGTISVTVKPDGKNYVGDAKEYTFNTEVGGAAVAPVDATITFNAGTGTVNPIAETDNFSASTAATTLKVNIDNINGAVVAGYQWFGADNVDDTPSAIADSGKTRTLKISDYDAAKANQRFYVVIWDTEGNEYVSGVVTLQAQILKSVSLAAATPVTFTNGGQNASVAVELKDQFGLAIATPTVTVDKVLATTAGTNDAKQATVANATQAWSAGTLSWDNGYATNGTAGEDSLTQKFSLSKGGKKVVITVTYSNTEAASVAATASAGNVIPDNV